MVNGPEWIQAIAGAVRALLIIKNFLATAPEGPDKHEALQAAQQLEDGFQVAQAQLAESLSYPLCKAHWPPEIMLSKGNLYDPYTEQFQCPECERIWPGEDPP